MYEFTVKPLSLVIFDALQSGRREYSISVFPLYPSNRFRLFTVAKHKTALFSKATFDEYQWHNNGLTNSWPLPRSQ